VSVTASKNNLISELFVRTADENYITARWCAINHLDTDFLWLAVHALEKYLKAVLLANGRSAKRRGPGQKFYGHDIVMLYEDVKVLAGPLLPENLVKPPDLNTSLWFDRTSTQFVEHLLKNGNADNRYSIYGYVTLSQDLHMLDTMVFAVRRLVCALDERWISSREPGAPTLTNRELLTRQPEYHAGVSMPLDVLIRSREESPKRFAALNLNLAFAPSDFQHEPLRSGTSSRNPVIYRRILEPLASENAQWAAEGVELARWLLENVQIPRGTASDPGVANQIEAAIEAARTKHGIP